MALSIGTDLVRVDRIRRITERWGDRFLRRIYSSEERDYCLSLPNPWPSLAVRWAAKEAFFKASASSALSWRDVAVRRRDSGRPTLDLRGRARAVLGSGTAHVSLSHDGDYAVAVVVLELSGGTT